MPTSSEAIARWLRSVVATASLVTFLDGCGASNSAGSTLPATGHNEQIHGSSRTGVVVDPSQVGAQVTTAVLGADMGVWFNIAQPGLAAAFVSTSLTTTRWPGGHAADRYHWRTNRYGTGSCGKGFNVGKPNPNSTFGNFMTDIATQAHVDVAITVNYGSNAQCTGGAIPAEAADWVRYANFTKGYNLTWWTVGNEQYTPDSVDLRSQPHNPSQYAQVVSSDYYRQMKAASPVPINVCVDVAPWVKGWDATVLTQAQFDCVELHYYPQQGGHANDAFLIYDAAPGLTGMIKGLQGELAAAGRGGTPIYLAEVGSTTYPAGKQTMSITQVLYAGQVIGEILNDGIARATWHSGYAFCEPPSKGGDFSRSLYGWQNYGGDMIFSGGDIAKRCDGYNVPLGTLLPTAVAFKVAGHFVRNGEHMLGVSVVGFPSVRAYATTYHGGYALMLFNLSKTSSQKVPVTITGKTSGSRVRMWTYDKTLYDATKNNVWNGPVTHTLPKWTGDFTVSLPPWSMSVVRTK